MPDELITLLPGLHCGSTWFMVGLIWFVQVVHYPLMGRVHKSNFSEYALSHQKQTTWVVGPAMLIEACASIGLLWHAMANDSSSRLAWVGVGLLAIAWGSTFAIQVPLHTRLARGLDGSACRRLVVTNWIRTAAWSARGVVAILMLHGPRAG